MVGGGAGQYVVRGVEREDGRDARGRVFAQVSHADHAADALANEGGAGEQGRAVPPSMSINWGCHKMPQMDCHSARLQWSPAVP